MQAQPWGKGFRPRRSSSGPGSGVPAAHAGCGSASSARDKSRKPGKTIRGHMNWRLGRKLCGQSRHGGRAHQKFAPLRCLLPCIYRASQHRICFANPFRCPSLHYDDPSKPKLILPSPHPSPPICTPQHGPSSNSPLSPPSRTDQKAVSFGLNLAQVLGYVGAVLEVAAQSNRLFLKALGHPGDLVLDVLVLGLVGKAFQVAALLDQLLVAVASGVPSDVSARKNYQQTVALRPSVRQSAGKFLHPPYQQALRGEPAHRV